MALWFRPSILQVVRFDDSYWFSPTELLSSTDEIRFSSLEVLMERKGTMPYTLYMVTGTAFNHRVASST